MSSLIDTGYIFQTNWDELNHILDIYYVIIKNLGTNEK